MKEIAVMGHKALPFAFLCLAIGQSRNVTMGCPRGTYLTTTWTSQKYSLSVGRADVTAVKVGTAAAYYFGGRTSVTDSSDAIDFISTTMNSSTAITPGLSVARHQSAGATSGNTIVVAGGNANAQLASNVVDIFTLDDSYAIINRTTASLSANRSRLSAVAVPGSSGVEPKWMLFAGGQSGPSGSTKQHNE